MKFVYGPESRPIDGYTIKRAIDRGGFGEVYYALSDSGKEVAVKLLQHNQQVELRGVTQCLNLKHPNLITIFDIRTDAEDDHWVIMEYISGRCLEQVLGDYPNGMPIVDIEGWLNGMSEGIAFLHDRGIVHRDLKPANVFRENGVVKVGDVGLCKFITPSRRSAQTESVGTVYYMAPEVARGKYGCELDVYSLGIMLHEMLTGRVPFDGESTGEILMKHLTEAPDLMSLPAALRPVLERALEKDPAKRTRSPLLLAREFHEAVIAARLDPALPVMLPPTAGTARPFNQTVTHYGNDLAAKAESAAAKIPPIPLAGAAAAYAGTATAGAAAVAAGMNSASAEAVTLDGVMLSLGRWWHENPASPRNMPWPYAGGAFVLIARADKWLFSNPTMVLIVGSIAAFVFLNKSSARYRKHKSDAARQAAGMNAATQRPPVQNRYGRASQGGPPPLRPKGAPVVVPVSGAAKTDREYVVSSESDYLLGGKAPPVVPVRPVALPPVAIAHKAKPKPAEKLPKAEYTPLTSRKIDAGLKLAQLSSSFIWAAVFTAALTAITSATTNIFEGYWSDARPDLVAMFAVPTLLCSWLVLGVTKLWEGSLTATSYKHRLAMFIIGGLAGTAVYGLQEFLFVDLEYRNEFDFGLVDHEIRMFNALYNFRPTLPAYAAVFGSMFGLRRWWLITDSFRGKRFAVSSVIVTAVMAYLIPAAFSFPQQWCVAWAVATSVVVQLSASFVRRQDRAAIVEQPVLTPTAPAKSDTVLPEAVAAAGTPVGSADAEYVIEDVQPDAADVPTTAALNGAVNA